MIIKVDKVLKKLFYFVMDKSLLVVSGDKYDYYSFLFYWWLDLSKKDGMFYLCKDGEINFVVNSDVIDKKCMNNFSEDVYYLVLVYSFIGKLEYVDKVCE